MSEVGVYSTGLKQCILPHYDKVSFGLTQDINLPQNSIFDAQKEIFDSHGHIMSPVFLGMCAADLFTTFGLSSRDAFIRDIFSPIHCYTGNDVIVSYLVANNAYKIVDKDAFTPPSCRESNIVFKKGCLIVPRGEIIWSLLAYNAQTIAIGDDPSDQFKIYVSKCGGARVPGEKRVNKLETVGVDVIYKSHYSYSNDVNEAQFDDLPPVVENEPILADLVQVPVADGTEERKGEIVRITEENNIKQREYNDKKIKYDKDVAIRALNVQQIVKSRFSSEQKVANTTQYVYLNPNLYAKLKSFRCIDPHNMSLIDQDYILYTMNLFYSEFFSTLALISAPPDTLLMYPPGTLEMNCPPKPDTMVVTLPNYNDLIDLKRWTITETEIGYGLKDAIRAIVEIPKNMILIGDLVSMNICRENMPNTNRNIVEAIEQKKMMSVRDEYSVIKRYNLETNSFKYFNENSGIQFFKKIIKNSYPETVKDGDTVISTYTPNCILTPLGIVATKSICENDPLVIGDHKLDIKQLNVQPKTGWSCEIESVQLPSHVEAAIGGSESGRKKAGVLRQFDQKELKFPLNYSPHFIAAMGTNINILPN